MRLQAGLKNAVRGLIDELMFLLPVDAYEAQRFLTAAFERQEVVKILLTWVELDAMEAVKRELKQED
jgi:hypothetical protein